MPIFGETCPQYLALTSDCLARPQDAAKFLCSPPLRNVFDQSALWDGLRNGSLQVIAIFGSECPVEECPVGRSAQRLATGDCHLWIRVPCGQVTATQRLGFSDYRAHQVVSSDHSAYHYEAQHSGQAAKTMADADGTTRPFHKVSAYDCHIWTRVPKSTRPFHKVSAYDCHIWTRVPKTTRPFHKVSAYDCRRLPLSTPSDGLDMRRDCFEIACRCRWACPASSAVWD